MKYIFFILLVYSQQNSFAQAAAGKFFSAAEAATPAQLSQFLTAADSSDRQKVTSIFNWIANNIEYNVARFQYGSRNKFQDVVEDEDDSTAPLTPLDERVAIMVLKRRMAVCGGYASLFKTLCNYAGIRCEVITGVGKTSPGRIDMKFTSNHRWNAVYFDTAWHLLDATWASGHVNYRNEFQRAYNPAYFLSPPEDFILDHYPDDLRWTLLANPPLLKEFMYTPFKTSSFHKNYITSFLPASGTIEAAVGDNIVFTIRSTRSSKLLWATDMPYLDSGGIFVLQCCGAVRPENIVQGGTVSYTYKVNNAGAEWLNVVYDDNIIMRYKLNIKKEGAILLEEILPEVNK